MRTVFGEMDMAGGPLKQVEAYCVFKMFGWTILLQRSTFFFNLQPEIL
jgi:hypothetical protein